MRCRIDLRHDEAIVAPPLDRDLLQRVLDAALARDDMDRCAISVILADDATCAQLHATHFGDPHTTDVMSFPDGSFDPELERRHLGDIAVCVDTARRAADDEAGAAAECILYILHGLLHLLGYDDQDTEDRHDMWTLQRDLLADEGLDPGPEPE